MTDLMTMSTVGKDIQTDDPPHKKITCYKAHNVFITDTESNVKLFSRFEWTNQIT